jgi:hypothetical protein
MVVEIIGFDKFIEILNNLFRCQCQNFDSFYDSFTGGLPLLLTTVEIKIKWIKRKQMTHENTYRDDNIV